MDVLLLNTGTLDIRSEDFAFTDMMSEQGGLALCATKDMPPYTQEQLAGYIRQGRSTAGGPGNTAPLLARAGLKVAVGVTLGAGEYGGLDVQGRTFYDALSGNGVDVSATKVHPTLPTGTTFIREGGSRERGNIAYFPNANNDFDFDAYKPDVVRLKPTVVYYMYSGLSERGDANGGRDLAEFITWSRKQGALTIADSHTLTGNPQALIAAGTPVEAYRLLEPLLGELDIFFTSVDEARMILNTLDNEKGRMKNERCGTKEQTIHAFLNFAQKRFMGQGRAQLFGVTVKNGAYVCFVKPPRPSGTPPQEGNEVRFIESRFMDGRVVDLVGAGDSFRAGVVGYVSRHVEEFRDGSLNVEEAIQTGNLMATLFVTAPLANRYGNIPTMDELLRRVREV